MPHSNLEDILHHYPEITGVHPACYAVPGISSDDFEALCESIARDGLRHEMLLTEDGQLIDGRNRLLACYHGAIEARFRRIATDPWQVAYAENIARRHLQVGQRSAFGVAWKEHEAAAAKERERVRKGNQPGADKCGNVTTLDTGKARDKAGERMGVSGSSIDKAAKVKEFAPDIFDELREGTITLESGYKEARKREAALNARPIDTAPKAIDDSQLVALVTPNGNRREIAKPKKVVFNHTTDAVDWARWTWNPVTGCEHGCSFCYAREIANSERMKPYYPNGFEPTFHEYRLEAPANTKVPDTEDDRDGRVFVCSMADLFGKWVPFQWILRVFETCMESPQWEYLFLTKWPARYAKLPLIENAWYGASIVQQSDVKRVEKAMSTFAAKGVVRWVSMEPMLEPIVFENLDWCDLVVIGAQTSTTQPEGYVPAFAPKFDWIVDVVNQCREAGVPYYLKANLGLDQPGMDLPKQGPRVR
jgi:protein gp37